MNKKKKKLREEFSKHKAILTVPPGKEAIKAGLFLAMHGWLPINGEIKVNEEKVEKV